MNKKWALIFWGIVGFNIGFLGSIAYLVTAKVYRTPEPVENSIGIVERVCELMNGNSTVVPPNTVTCYLPFKNEKLKVSTSLAKE